jgi:hypothetical protein
MAMACRRALGGASSALAMPASTLMHSSVCPRASDRKSAGIFFRGKYLRGGPIPLLLAACDAGDNRADLGMRPAGPVPVLHPGCMHRQALRRPCACLPP